MHFLLEEFYFSFNLYLHCNFKISLMFLSIHLYFTWMNVAFNYNEQQKKCKGIPKYKNKNKESKKKKK